MIDQKALYGIEPNDPAFVITIESIQAEIDSRFRQCEGAERYLLCDGVVLAQKDGVVLDFHARSGLWYRANWFYEEQRPILDDDDQRVAYYNGPHTR